MQYFGYLRRNPNVAPDTGYTGYDFWLTKLNSFTQPGDNVLVRIQILCGFYYVGRIPSTIRHP